MTSLPRTSSHPDRPRGTPRTGAAIAAAIAALAASTKVDTIDATNNAITLTVAQEAAADAKLVAGDTITVADIGVTLGLNMAALAASPKVDVIDATTNAITMTVANELAADAKLVVGDTITVSDTGANIAAMSVAQLGSTKLDVLDTTDGEITLTPAQYDVVALEAAEFFANDKVIVQSAAGADTFDFNGVGGNVMTLLMADPSAASDTLTNFNSTHSDLIWLPFLGIPNTFAYTEISNDTSADITLDAHIVVIGNATDIATAAAWIAADATVTRTNGLIVIDDNGGNTEVYVSDNLAGNGTETLMVTLTGIPVPTASLLPLNFDLD